MAWEPKPMDHLDCSNPPSSNILHWVTHSTGNLIRELSKKSKKIYFTKFKEIPTGLKFHYSMCKMKPSCGEETAYPLTYTFVVNIVRIKQSVRHYWATRGINHWVTIPICELFVTLLLTCDTCDVLVTTCDLLVVLLLLLLTCDCIQMKFYWKLREILIKLSEIFFKIEWNFVKNYMKFF